VAGIDIGANWSALVIAVLLGYGLAFSVLPAGAPHRSVGAYVIVAILVAVLFLAALLAHELAHALVARRYGVSVRRITLWLLGGVSEMEAESPTPRAELLISGAGPATSLVLGGIFALATLTASGVGADRLLVVALGWLAGVNLLLGVFNLLPGAPLDGGRIVRAVVWRWTGDRDRAQVAADRAGVALGVVLGALGLLQVVFARNLSGLWLVLLGWFLISAANAETAGVRLHRALHGRSVRDIMATDPVVGLDSQSIDAFIADTASRQPHGTYPVVDGQGHLVGVVHLDDLTRIPQEGRSQLPLRAAAEHTPAAPTVTADAPAADAARNLSPGNRLLPVTEHDRLVGVVGARDVEKAVSLATLGHPSPPTESA
jgi:Zn-dependent protease/CBS domain-containing protein